MKSEVEAKKLVPERFHRWIKVFGKKQSERMKSRNGDGGGTQGIGGRSNSEVGRE